MCTVLLRFSPAGPWPVILGAVRDEFAERSWDAPSRHWSGPAAHLVGGRDHTAGGTWLAVDPHQLAVAAVLNGPRREPPEDGPRPTRGDLCLRILTEGDLPADLSRYDRFHLLRATTHSVDLWTWDAEALHHTALSPGPHIVVNGGLDTTTDALVPHFAPLVAALPEPSADGSVTWAAWVDLLGGDGLDPADPRALVVRREVEGRIYGSTSASLVALSPTSVRYDFTPTPGRDAPWAPVDVGEGAVVRSSGGPG